MIFQPVLVMSFRRQHMRFSLSVQYAPGISEVIPFHPAHGQDGQACRLRRQHLG